MVDVPIPTFHESSLHLVPYGTRGQDLDFPFRYLLPYPDTISAIRCVSSRKRSTASKILHGVGDGTYSTYQMASNIPGPTGSNIAKWKLHGPHTSFECMTWALTFPLNLSQCICEMRVTTITSRFIRRIACEAPSITRYRAGSSINCNFLVFFSLLYTSSHSLSPILKGF